jgi:hypothetical protein
MSGSTADGRRIALPVDLRGAPLAARVLAAAAPHLSPASYAELVAGKTNTRALQEEIGRVSRVVPIQINLSRSDFRAAIHWLVRATEAAKGNS